MRKNVPSRIIGFLERMTLHRAVSTSCMQDKSINVLSNIHASLHTQTSARIARRIVGRQSCEASGPIYSVEPSSMFRFPFPSPLTPVFLFSFLCSLARCLLYVPSALLLWAHNWLIRSFLFFFRTIITLSIYLICILLPPSSQYSQPRLLSQH